MLSDQNQKILSLALYVLVGLMGVAGLSLLVKTYYMANPKPTSLAEHTITLSATGQAVGVPDVARITLSVVEEGATVGDTVAAGNKKMTDIINGLKQTGIDEKDIKTTAYDLTPQYNYQEQPYKIEKYQLTQSVEVTIRQLDQIATIVDQATKSGANSVGTPRFEVDDPEALRAQAREDALTDVKQKAESLAKAAGVKLGKVVTFSEANEGTTTPRPYYDAVTKSLGTAESAATIQAGSDEIQVNVTVTFEVK